MMGDGEKILGNTRALSELTISHLLDESVLKLVNILHQLLVHLDLLHGYLSSVGKVVAHVVVLLVLYRALQRRDHLALPLNELHLFLDSVQVRVVDALFCTHSLFLKCLRVHHSVRAHV